MPMDCQICGQLGQGFHFGVISCRACAAFFRRAANSKWSKMECLSRHCTRENYHCKPCRLKRCRAVGMDTSKFQHNRDSIMVPQTSKSLTTFETFVGRPHMVLFTDQEPTKRVFVNVSKLMRTAKLILKKGCESPLIADNNNHLKKLGHAVKLFNIEKNPTFVETVTQFETSKIWEFYFLTTAKWLTYFEPFQQLEDPIKIQILLAVWHVFSRLHKLIATALYRNRNKNAELTERCTGDGLLTDLAKSKSDTAWMSRYPPEQVAFFLDGVRGFDLIPLISCLESYQISQVEMTFMMAQLCFQYASGRFGGKVSEIMERFQEILTNDLHSYYIEQQNPRYAGRLAKLMKINNEIQENIRKHRGRAEIARIFEIFQVDFSHPDMFQDTGLV